MSLSSPNRGGNVDDFYSWSTPYSRKSGMAVSPSKLSPFVNFFVFYSIETVLIYQIIQDLLIFLI